MTSFIIPDYNWSMSPTYHNNTEYRQTIRELFFMKPLPDLDSDIDDISRDEMDFDDSCIDKVMEQLFRGTREHPLFRELYLLAASRLISEDLTMGQAVLFSYDYLEVFHYCLVSFFREPGDFNETNVFYIELKRKLT
jgi:hypothetical protein